MTTAASAAAMEVGTARRDTPGCTVDDGRVHLNAAAAALQPRPVIEAVLSHIAAEAELGGAEAETEAEPALAGVYAALAELLGCAPDEVAVTDSAARGWQAVVHSLPLAPGDRVLAAVDLGGGGDPAAMNLARACEAAGATLEPIPAGPSGAADPAALAAALCPRVKLVAASHVNAAGMVQPAAALGAAAAAHGVPFLLDASRSAGQLPLDVDTLQVDFLTGAGAGYLRGPRGTGFLYVRRARTAGLVPRAVDSRSAAWGPGAPGPAAEAVLLPAPTAVRFESAEANVAAKLGLGTAARYAVARQPDAIAQRVCALADELRRRLAAVPGVELRGGAGRPARSGLVAFGCPGLDATELAQQLADRGVIVGVAGAAVVAAVHYYNSVGEMKVAADRVAALLTEEDELSADWVELDGTPPSPIDPHPSVSCYAGATEPNPVFDRELPAAAAPAADPAGAPAAEPEPEPEPAAAQAAPDAATAPVRVPPPTRVPPPEYRSVSPVLTRSLLFLGASPPGFGLQLGGPLLGHKLGSLGCSPQSLLGVGSASPASVAASSEQAAAAPSVECYLNGMCCDDEDVDEPAPMAAAGLHATAPVVGFEPDSRIGRYHTSCFALQDLGPLS